LRAALVIALVVVTAAPVHAVSWWPWAKRDAQTAAPLGIMPPQAATQRYDPPGPIKTTPQGQWPSTNDTSRYPEFAAETKKILASYEQQMAAMKADAAAYQAERVATFAAINAAANAQTAQAAGAPTIPEQAGQPSNPPAPATTAGLPPPTRAPAPVREWQAIADQEAAAQVDNAATPRPITPIIVRPLRPEDQRRDPKSPRANPGSVR
jgi:hypothetical protein